MIREISRQGTQKAFPPSRKHKSYRTISLFNLWKAALQQYQPSFVIVHLCHQAPQGSATTNLTIRRLVDLICRHNVDRSIWWRCYNCKYHKVLQRASGACDMSMVVYSRQLISSIVYRSWGRLTNYLNSLRTLAMIVQNTLNWGREKIKFSGKNSWHEINSMNTCRRCRVTLIGSLLFL